MDKHPASVPALLDSLRHLRETNPKAVRATIHIYPPSVYDPDSGTIATKQSSQSLDDNQSSLGNVNLKERRIVSWKMTEHMYFNAQNPFPTLARGLFTEAIEQAHEEESVPPSALKYYDGEKPRDRIVARGYDKFFNIDETAWTNWEAMKEHTKPPYSLTLKSNGCLILISALSPVHLVVASKHSLGTMTDIQQEEEALAKSVNDMAIAIPPTTVTTSSVADNKTGKHLDEEQTEAKQHAQVGRDWLNKTLASKGKTQQELAKRLWDENLTAVLELCDDDFEEHVIATPKKWTGLHLHGLNYNTPHFSTKTASEVSSFANEFGFIQTKHIELQSIDQVRSYTTEIAKTGTWEGDAIEGFVVRTMVRQSDRPGKPPYRPDSPFFFKVKFDEPYMLYRQWREMTRIMLPLMSATNEKQVEIWKKVRARSKRPEVGLYAEWCGKMLKEEPRLFDNYDKGVVRVRERFLEWAERDGKEDWEAAKKGTWKMDGVKKVPDKDKEGLPKRWVIVPISVPGSGKTLVGVALNKLFGFGHTQSDDVTAKRTAPTFLRNILALLQKNEVVYADRNNHIEKHYTELANLAKDKQVKDFDVHFIGIVWDIDSQPYHRLLRLCSERVVNRGDNHQTLRPDATINAEHEAVVSNFIRNWTKPDEAIFDQWIPVAIDDEPLQLLHKIITPLCSILEIEKPTDEAVKEAIDEAMRYQVTTPYHPIQRVGKDVRYFGLAPELDLDKVIDQALSSPMSSDMAKSARNFVKKLREKKRVTEKPHVTLCHEKNVLAEKEAMIATSKSLDGTGHDSLSPGPEERAWKTCESLAIRKIPILFDFQLTRLVWDDRVMALTLESIHPQKQSDNNDWESQVVEIPLSDTVKANLHVTVGTQSEEISAFESRGIIKAAREAKAFTENNKEGETKEVVEGGGKVFWVDIEPIKGQGRVKGMY